ncbi:hypothetical protein NP493_199g01001 [Ridgeia piscesae]|uniref:Uncharacterized protein n=1 Tax=Ridgeia piscesae TaxID=27915 RepID=A0AAD9P1J3_RIDPI|nr:hypothetical protein NP493_199g01001 [Ridgeia piscesae]
MLNKWLSANFEKSKDAELSTNVNITYDHYVTACIAANNIVPVKVEELRKTLFEMFGSSFVVKDDSAYKGVIRKQKKKKSSATKVRSDTLKMKDVLRTTFTTLGNPKKGLRFRALQQSIAANFPGLKIELHPAVLKRALERGIYSGDLECVSCCLFAVSISALYMQCMGVHNMV